MNAPISERDFAYFVERLLADHNLSVQVTGIDMVWFGGRPSRIDVKLICPIRFDRALAKSFRRHGMQPFFIAGDNPCIQIIPLRRFDGKEAGYERLVSELAKG